MTKCLLESVFPQKVSKTIQLSMEQFASGEIKILVCTHIIESGIDIANANTMIVQYAELFGLAQLYQVTFLVNCVANFIHVTKS
jgi:transcription-repair coupling factor (superfamily II helicase)